MRARQIADFRPLSEADDVAPHFRAITFPKEDASVAGSKAGERMLHERPRRPVVIAFTVFQVLRVQSSREMNRRDAWLLLQLDESRSRHSSAWTAGGTRR